jgi:hypothetical protein
MPLLYADDPQPRLLACCGFKYSGKSTAAALAGEAWGFRRTSLATPIKDAALAMGVPRQALYGSEAEREAPLACLGGATGRSFLEQLGDWGRERFGAEYWLRIWAMRADESLAAGEGLLAVDDLRYDDEDDFLAAWAEARGLPYLLLRTSAPDREDARASHRSARVPGDVRVGARIDNSRTACPARSDLEARVRRVLGDWDARLRAGLAPAAGRSPRW